MARLVWNHDSNQIVATQAVKILTANPEMKVIDAIREAVKALPKSQQKEVKQMAQVTAALRIMEKITGHKIERPPKEAGGRSTYKFTVPKAKPAQPPAPAVNGHESHEPPTLTTVEATTAPPESHWFGPRTDEPKPEAWTERREEVRRQDDLHVERRTLPPLPRVPTRDELVAGLAGFGEEVVVATIRRVFTNPDVVGIIRAIINGRMPEVAVSTTPVPKHDPTPVSAERNNGPTILVCGLKPHLYSSLQSQIGKRLNLKFWYDGGSGGSGLGQLKDKLQNADAAVYSMDSSSHSHVRMAEVSGVRVYRVTGATDSVLRTLNEIAVGYGR